MSDALIIDGAHGEGGGQILRTAMSLAAATGTPIGIENIRGGRPRPGLMAQHVTAVRAVAACCAGSLSGDHLGSMSLRFIPRSAPQAGAYDFDVGAARPGGSAGAATLVLQALVPPLLVAKGRSTIVVRGGTHMLWSPPFDYLRDVWIPALRRIGAEVAVELHRSGWFPVGQGEIGAAVTGFGQGARSRLRPLRLEIQGMLRRVSGRALVARLPVHIAMRMAGHAETLLHRAGIKSDIAFDVLDAACPGAGLFLFADYGDFHCGFNAIGRRGKPAEAVAEEAVAALLAHRESGATVDNCLADQLLVPLSLTGGPSVFTTERASRHLETNAWVIERFGIAAIGILGDALPRRAKVEVVPRMTGGAPAR